MAVRIISHIKEWSEGTEKKVDAAVLEMATDIHREAVIMAPRLSGALAGSGQIKRNGIANYTISFGSSRLPYARRRHYENKLHPNTLLYLERPGDRISRNLNRYLRGI